jgi:hypothetical protein
MCATVARRYMDEDGQAEKSKGCLLARNGEDARDTSFLRAATSRSEPFVTLPKFRSRLIQPSPSGAAASSSAE